MSNIKKTFEDFLGSNNKYGDLENLSKKSTSGEVDSALKNKILDVENFNEWLSNMAYGAGLIGRIDKLSPNMVEQYFTDQGVECEEREIRDFMEKIRLTWKKR